MELSDTEKLAIFTAAYKWAKERADDLRPSVEEDTKALYDMGHVTQQEVTIFGEKVGTISATQTKEGFVVTDLDKFVGWCRDAGYAEPSVDTHNLSAAQIREIADRYGLEIEWTPTYPAEDIQNVKGQPMDGKTGEIIPGMEHVNSGYKSMMVRIKSGKVADVLNRNDRGLVSNLLLGDGLE